MIERLLRALIAPPIRHTAEVCPGGDVAFLESTACRSLARDVFQLCKLRDQDTVQSHLSCLSIG